MYSHLLLSDTLSVVESGAVGGTSLDDVTSHTAVPSVAGVVVGVSLIVVGISLVKGGT